MTELSRAANRTVSRFVEMTAGAGIRPAMAVVKHTFGEGVRFHPHLHALVTSGGWDRSRVWHPLPTWDQGVLRELFEIEVFRFLRKRELLSRERMELIRSWPHSGCNVHVGEAVAPDDKISLTRVARYMLRAPVVMSRISYDRTRATVHIDSHGPHSEGPLELDVLDFIPRLTVQITEAHERLVHYYGLYSNASRQRRVSGGREKTSACPADHLDGDDSGTSGSSTPTRRLRAIILHPSSAGHLSGEPETPRTWPHLSPRAGRSLPGQGTRLASRVRLYAQGPMISPQNPSAAR